MKQAMSEKDAEGLKGSRKKVQNKGSQLKRDKENRRKQLKKRAK